MREKKTCKIIQDLLPNYIERLTNEETNKYIEEHLKECNDCREILENMQKNVNINITNKDKKAIKYLKKYRKKLRTLKIVILIIIVLFIGNTARKMIILSEISNKAEEFINTENYHRVSYNYDKDSTSILEIFGLGDKKKLVMINMTPEGTKVVTMYARKKGVDQWGNEKYDANIYTVTENSKMAKLNSEVGINVDPQNMIHIENFLELLLISVPTDITTTTYDGEDCYFISNVPQNIGRISNNMYVSKNKGLVVSIMGYEVEYSDSGLGRWPATDYVYEFNTVTETDFIEPDINEYKIEE